MQPRHGVPAIIVITSSDKIHVDLRVKSRNGQTPSPHTGRGGGGRFLGPRKEASICRHRFDTKCIVQRFGSVQ